MPNYQNLNPPIALASGDVGFSFNNEAFPGSAQAGSQFALLSYAGAPDSGTTVRWQLIYGAAPTAVSMVLQAAMADIDAEYQTIDTAPSDYRGGENGDRVFRPSFCESSLCRRRVGRG